MEISRRPVRRAALVAALAVGSLLVQACSGHDVALTLPRLPTPTPTPKPKPAPKPRPRPVNPLTGIGGPPRGPVIAVKIDNVAAARPQVGLSQANVVYVEQAEGGLTRLVAIYLSRRPRTVAPVRSVRDSDPELLAQYGPIVLAFSGGAGGPVATFRRSSLADGSAAAHGGTYRRLGDRPIPHNLGVDLYQLAREMPHAGGAHDVGFDWAYNDSRVAHSRSVSGFSVLIGSTPVSFRYSPPQHAFLQTIGGRAMRDASGPLLATPNVLVLFCRTNVDRGDIDAAGNPATYTHTLGSGRLLLFRDGHVLSGTWRRPKPQSATQYLDAHGKPLNLRPGGVWVLLAPTGSPARYG
jgi:hypothetical protein